MQSKNNNREGRICKSVQKIRGGKIRSNPRNPPEPTQIISRTRLDLIFLKSQADLI
jgi:hypothetical protein